MLRNPCKKICCTRNISKMIFGQKIRLLYLGKLLLPYGRVLCHTSNPQSLLCPSSGKAFAISTSFLAEMRFQTGLQEGSLLIDTMWAKRECLGWDIVCLALLYTYQPSFQKMVISIWSVIGNQSRFAEIIASFWISDMDTVPEDDF